MKPDKAPMFLALADELIPAYGAMPRFSSVCSFEDARAASDFRTDLKPGLERALACELTGGAEAALERLDHEDPDAFSAVSTIALATYYMNGSVRELIGYPGQESVSYDAHATQSYLLDGSLAKVVARGRRYRPTPGL